jgi:hypothetical protein
MSQLAHKKLLLVEGPDDQDVVYHFCGRRGIKHQAHFDVVSCKGYESMRRRVGTELKADHEAIGILVDADAAPENRWRSLRDVLQRHYSQREPTQLVPEPLDSGGLIVESKAWWQKRCGVWIMPDNARGGMLEDFLLALIPSTDTLRAYAQQAIAELPEQRFIASHRAKAEVHTWLAWQEQPGTPLGLAFARRYLDGDHTLAQRFHDWLVALFEIPAASA